MELTEELRRLAQLAAEAARDHLDDSLHGIIEAYTAGQKNEAEAFERARAAANFRDGRLRLILDTQKAAAQSIGQILGQTPAQLELYPAWRLDRRAWRQVPRQDWPQRWQAAGEAVAWQGASRFEMVALKYSPIWAALGAGAGGFKDAIGNPYPPFAFGSGLSWFRVSKDEWEALQ